MFHMVLNTSGFWTCLWFWICQGFLNIPEFWICLRFWIYKASGYTRNLNIPWVLNIPGFGACLWFWICKGSGYTGVLNMLVLDKVLDMPEYVWRISDYLIMPKYVWICLNMLEYAGIYLLDDFCVTSPLCNPLSAWMRGYLFQNLHETRSCSLKEHEVVFLTRQNLIFYLAAGSI